MNKSLFKTSFSLCGLLTTGVCFAQAPVVDLQEQDNRVIESSVQDTANGIRSGAITSYELEQKMIALEQIVDSRTESQQRMSMQIMELQNDIDSMRGSIELHNHQLEKLLERQRELFLELDRRFEGMQAQSSQLSQDIGGNGSTASTPSISSGSEQEAYQAAVNLILQDKNYDAAIPAFQAFLDKYPNSDLSANSHYWLGQLLFNQQQYAQAKTQFEQVANRFTDSPKRADSLLKLGLIAKSQGNASSAENFFDQVINEYPGGTPARLAQQQLAN